MSDLPPQEDVQGTHLALLAIEAWGRRPDTLLCLQLRQLHPDLQWISDIYAVHTLGQWLSDGNSSHVRYNKFFVLEHIPMLDEVPKATWDHAKDQLINCINSPRDPGDGSILLADTVYGAVAIGRYVKMYRYNRAERTVIPWNQADKEYHIKRQCATVHNILKQIKDHH
ncbi:hypothetical protein VTN00DRAFT_1931 [Thermoascus crustaceus]|uniref:uncharacterized protein n=1 Tax=Thermoascus crustaceus TaxID=5088 RepID=UPI003742CFB2